MRIRTSAFTILAALVLVCGPGCGKSGGPGQKTADPAPRLSADTVARIHWLGKKCLGTNAQTYYFMRLWGMPETKQVQAQILDKLSLMPGRLFGDFVTNTSSSLLRPLLDDMVQEETFLEIRETADHSNEAALAIRLSAQRALVWETNIAAIAESLKNSQRGPGVIELKRVGEWTIIGGAHKENLLFTEFAGRIRRDDDPFPTGATNYWLEADIDPVRATNLLGLGQGPVKNLPHRISVTVSGDGGNVITRGGLSLSEEFLLPPEAWAIPTNLIREPVTSFIAVRGIGPFLASMQAWNDLQMGSPPNQLFSWSPQDDPLETCVAVPLPDAGARMHTIIDALLLRGNPWLAAKNAGSFQPSQGSNSVIWSGLPLFSPFIQSIGTDSRNFLFAGTLLSTGQETNPPPMELFRDLTSRTNIVASQWELTGQRIDSGLNLSQLARLASHRNSLRLESPGALWLNALIHRVGACTTIVTAEGTNRLAFVRKSTVGLTGLELHLLVEWLSQNQPN